MSKQHRQQRGSNTARSSNAATGSTGENSARSQSGPVDAPPWWKRAGSWIADKYDDVATAVGDTVDNVTDTVKDGWDVLSNTDMDVDWRERKVSVETDMDEVMDFMPDDVRAMIQLDREAEGANKVAMELDYKNDRITIVSKDVRIVGVKTATLSTGGISLKDVRIAIQGDGGLPLMGNAKKTGVDISFAQAIAEEVTAQTKNGPVSAKRLELGATTMQVTGEGKELPNGQDGSAKFYVSNAIIDGLSGADGGAEQVKVEALNGGLDTAEGTGFVEAASIAATGAQSKGSSIGATSVTGARVDMRKGESGVEHTVAVSSANVGDVKTADGNTIDAASVSDLSATYGDHALNLAAAQLGVSGVGGKTSLESANVSNLSVSAAGLGGESWNANVGMDGAALKGLKAGNMRLDSAKVSDLKGSAQMTEQGLSTTGSVGYGEGRGIQSGKVSMNQLFVRDGSMASAGGVTDAKATRADVNGLDINGTTAQSIGVDHFATQQRGRNDGTYSAGRVRAKGLDADGTSLGSADAKGVYVDSRNGVVDARMADAKMKSIASGDNRIADASVSGLQFNRVQDGGLSASVDKAAVGGVSSTVNGKTVTVGQASIEGAKGSKDGDIVTGSLGRADLSNFAMDGTTVKSAGVQGVSGSHGPQSSWLNVDGMQAGGVSAGGVVLDSVVAKRLAAERDADGMTGSLAGVDVAGIHTHSGTVDRASATGIAGATSGGTSGLTVQGMSAAGVDMGANRAKAVTAGGLSVNHNASGVSGSLANLNASNVRTIGLTAGEVSASGLSGAKSGSTTTVGLDALNASNLAHRGEGTSLDVDRVGIQNAGATLSERGMNASAGEVRVDGISGKKSGGAGTGGQSGGSPSGGAVSGGAPKSGGGVDPALIRSLGALVDDADIRARVPMTAGKYAAGSQDLTVKRDTELNASVAIRDGNLVPGAARADFSNALDGPLWVGVRGAYLDDKGSLRANLSGAPDLNIGKSAGLGKTIDPSVAGMANRAADGMSGNAAGGSTGGGGSGPASRGAGKPSLGSSFDTQNMTVDANIALRNGTLDMGNGTSAQLAGQKPTDNAVSVQGGGREDLVMTFTRFLTSSLRMGVGGADVQAGSASVEQGKVSLDKNAQEGTAIEGTVGSITLKDVQAKK